MRTSKSLPAVLPAILFLTLALPLHARSASGDDFLEIFGKALIEAAADDSTPPPGERKEKPVWKELGKHAHGQSNKTRTGPGRDSRKLRRARKAGRKRPARSRGERKGNTRLFLRRIAKGFEAVGLTSFLLSLLLLFTSTLIPMVGYSLFRTAESKQSLADISRLVDEHPWKTFFLGLFNGLLLLVLTLILLRSPLLSIPAVILACCLIDRLLTGVVARSLRLGKSLLPQGESAKDSILRTLVGTVALWASFCIPLLGQALFLVTVSQGFGAFVLQKLRASVAAPTSPSTVEETQPGRKTA